MRPNLPPLTSLRFFAALGVVVFHYNLTNNLLPNVIARFGNEAVTFFFVLSGFILTYAHGLPGAGMNVSPREFFIARLARIWPVYCLAVVIVVLLFFIVGVLNASIVLRAVPVILMVQAWFPHFALALNPPAWSLSNEIFFYICFPALWGVTRKLSVTLFLAVAAALVVFVALIRVELAAGGEDWDSFRQYFPVLNFPQFIWGTAIGYLFVAKEPLGQRAHTMLFLIGAVALGTVMVFKPTFEWLSSSTTLCVVYAAIILGAANVGGTVRKVLCVRFLTILGEASYAIYILHFPLWLWWNHYTKIAYELNLPSIVDFLSYMSILFLISLASLIFVEKPARLALSRRRSHAQ